MVTGCASGIGAAIVRRYTADGATVIIADIDRMEAAAVADEAGALASVMAMDAGDDEQVRSVFAEVADRHGRADMLVDKARTVLKGYPHRTRRFRSNYGRQTSGALFVAQAAALFVTVDGRIINMRSISGLLGFDTRTVIGLPRRR